MKERVILFDGTSLDGFHTRDGQPAIWDVKYGTVTVTKHDILSDYEYGDAHIHVEFKIPYMPGETGQGRGNSGVYVQGLYEIQVLDSYGKEDVKSNDCAGIYKIAAPLTNACLPPEEWQTYDIYLRAAKVDENNELLEPAIITVVHNGVVVHNNLKLYSTTGGSIEKHPRSIGPLLLQDHGCPVVYRNIWVQPLD